MTTKVRALGRPEIEHLAQAIREREVFVGLCPLAKGTKEVIAEALEEFARTVTEPE